MKCRYRGVLDERRLRHRHHSPGDEPGTEDGSGDGAGMCTGEMTRVGLEAPLRRPDEKNPVRTEAPRQLEASLVTNGQVDEVH